MVIHDWSVVVGNIGTVHKGDDETMARDIFDTYKHMSKKGHGRVADEEVSLFCDGEIVESHFPPSDKEM